MAEEMAAKSDQPMSSDPQVAASPGEAMATDAPSAPEASSGPAEEVSKLGSQDADEATKPADNSTSAETPAEPEAKEDAVMQDATVKDKATEDVPNGTPVTPAATKKASAGGSSKKKSAGVPEHKSKKLNRKKSKMDLHLECQPGELYLARMKGHPAWPSVVCDEAMLPAQLLNSRPVTTALPDGTFKKPEYADGGKRAHERTFPIMFLYTNEFAWMPNTDLTPIAVEDCQQVTEKGKTKALYEAYKVASEGHDLEHWKTMLAEHQEAINEDAERRAEREAKKAEKAEKARRKSEAADEMDIDEEDEEEKKPKSKKRKKSMDAEDADEKPAKTPKTTPKLKINAPKTPTSEKKKTPSKSKSSKKQAVKVASDDDDEIADTPMVEEKPLDPAEAKEKKEKEIRYYRHKLQKGFLSRDDVPGDEEIAAMSTYLQKLESYPDLEGSIIRATKIHKVLKAMIKLNSIPKDDEHHFKKRSMELLSKWNKILAVDLSGAGEKDEEKDKAEDKTDTKVTEHTESKTEEKPETNGVAKEVEPEASGALQEEDKAEPTDKIGTDVEGEKEAEKPTEGVPDRTKDTPAADYKPAEVTEVAEATEATA